MTGHLDEERYKPFTRWAAPRPRPPPGPLTRTEINMAKGPPERSGDPFARLRYGDQVPSGRPLPADMPAAGGAPTPVPSVFADDLRLRRLRCSSRVARWPSAMLSAM